MLKAFLLTASLAVTIPAHAGDSSSIFGVNRLSPDGRFLGPEEPEIEKLTNVSLHECDRAITDHQIDKLFQVVIGRGATPADFAYWEKQVCIGDVPMSEVASRLVNSPEAKALWSK